MRRRLSILTLICCSLLCTMVGISEVRATDSDYTDGTSAAINSCKGGLYCYTGAVGFRITLVNKTTGERCKYDSSTNTICGSSGNATSSKDYWFNKSDLAFNESTATYNRRCYSYDKKKTKYEFLTSNKEENIITNCSTTEESFTSLGFPGVGSNKYTDDWTTSDPRIEVSRSPRNMNLVERYLSCTLGGVSENGSRLNCTSKDGTTISEDYTIINNIFTNLTGTTIDVTKIRGLDNTGIQFEQLLQIGNYSKSKITSTIAQALVTKGTVAEASYLYMQKGTNANANFGCVTYNSDGFKHTQNTSCGSSMIGGGYFTGYYGNTSYSSTLTSTPDANSAIMDENLVNHSKLIGGYTLYDVNLNEFLKKDTTNIFKFWINPNIGPKCDDDFQNLIGVIKSDETYYKSSVGVDKNKLINYINDNKDKYKALIDDCAVVKNEKVVDFKTGENSCPLLANLNKMSVVLSSRMNTSNYGCSTDLTCSDAITAIKNDTTFASEIKKIIKYMNENGNLDGLTLIDTYTKIMEWMNDIWKGYPRLNSIFWAYLGDNGPSCKDDVPDCPVESPDMDCNTSGNVIFSTSTNAEGCIKKGVAYTIGEKDDIVSSLNVAYSNECYNCKVYCDERVTFNLVNQENLISAATEAGTLLKWGKGTNSQIFGTMTVKQTCYVVPDENKVLGDTAYLKTNGTNNSNLRSHLGSVSAGIDNSTAKYVNTKITIDYKNPAYYLKESNGDLNQRITLTALPTTRGVESVKYMGDNKIYSNTNIKDGESSIGDYNIFNNFVVSSDKSYMNIEKFTNYAHYVFAYGEYSGCTEYKNGACISYESKNGGVDGKSELVWYASKSDNNNYKTQDEYEKASSVEKNSYVFIGYGLPTPFTSVTCIYSSENMSTNNSNSKDEPITVTIQNIGTAYKNQATIDDSNGFMFTKLLENKKISYSCNYKIHNQIFGYENGDSIDCDYTPPKGLDVVFRTIELVNSDGDEKELKEQLRRAFPGMSGNGRDIGSNWDEWIDGNPNIVEDKANNIYKILSNAIYSEKPQYHIVLDVATIQKVRQYNKSARNNADPYSNMPSIEGSTDNGYLGYVCNNDSSTGYKFCASNFLTQLRLDSSVKFDGECIHSSYGGTTTKDRASAFVHASNGCLQHWWSK